MRRNRPPSGLRGVFQTLRRWRRSSAQRRYEWQLSPSYWRLRQRFLTASFWLSRGVFATRRQLRESWASASIIREILQTIVGQAILAVLLVAGAWLIDAGLERFGVQTRLVITIVNEETFVELLAALAQVAGAFLGLYFAAVSVVASTVYARVPGDVRSVLMQEKVGTVYIRMVALLGAVATLLLGLRAAGYEVVGLHLLLVTVLGLLAVFSFVILGTRAFNFFDPTSLAGYVAQDLLRNMKLATPDGVGWRSPSFQAHYQQLVERGLDTYRNIVTLAVSEAHLGGRAVVTLLARLLGVLQVYAREKVQIPSGSRWFRQQQRHRDWLTSDYTQVAVALQTGTSLQPEVVSDPMWVEEEIEGTATAAVRQLVEHKDLRNLAAICDAAQQTLGVLGERLAVDEGLRLFRALRSEVHRVATMAESEAPGRETLELSIAVVDTYAMGLISVLLGIARRLDTLTADRFGGLIDGLGWSNEKGIYSIELPRGVVEQLEYLANGLEFERRVEGRMVSPGWYRRQIAAQAFARFLWGAAGKLIDELEAAILRESEQLIASEQYFVAAQLIQRGFEAVEKLRVHLPRIEGVATGLLQFRVVGDIPWPPSDWERMRSRLEEVRAELVQLVARLAVHLATVPAPAGLPDYFGEGYARLAEESYSAMVNGKEELFKKLFPPFFLSGLTAHDRLREQLREHDQERALIYATEPLADLLELSGHAIIYSELDQKTFWDTAKRLWDAYFDQMPDRAAGTRFIHAMVEYRRSLFALLPRGLARTSWKQGLEHRLRKEGLMEDMFERRLSGKGRPPHQSAVIRALARGNFLYEEPTDVFMVIYLGRRPEAAGLELGHRAESFVRSLQREESGEENENGMEGFDL